MHFATKTSFLLLGAIGLAGCDETSDPFEFDPTFNSFAEIRGALQPDLLAVVEEDGTLTGDSISSISDGTDFDDLTTGSVTYKGAIIAEEVDDGGVLIGQLQLTADLDTSALEGIAGNFFHSEDGEYTGTLEGDSTFTEDVGTNGDHFDIQLTGNLQNGGTTFGTTADLRGNFLNIDDSVDQVAGDADLDLGVDAPDYEQGAFQGASD